MASVTPPNPCPGTPSHSTITNMTSQAPSTPPSGTTNTAISSQSLTHPSTPSQGLNYIPTPPHGSNIVSTPPHGLNTMSTHSNNLNTLTPPPPGSIQALLDLASNHQQLYHRPTTPPLPTMTTAYSKLPDIMTTQIKPTYTGTITGFFTFLFQLRERRSICHFWAPVTRFGDVDLLLNFTTVDLDQTLKQLSN